MGGVGWVACQGFLVREACVVFLVGGTSACVLVGVLSLFLLMVSAVLVGVF